MISVNLSINQLIEVIQNLNETEKQQVRQVLDEEDILLTDEQKQEILRRENEYKSGSMKTYSLAEVKASLNFRD
jgi:putative addiction module component (TIGR02574 family)